MELYFKLTLFHIFYYRTIRLENGLTALLISDPTKPAVSGESSSEEESSGSDESSGPESDGAHSERSAASDHHETKRRNDFDEEKLVSLFLCPFILFSLNLASKVGN